MGRNIDMQSQQKAYVAEAIVAGHNLRLRERLLVPLDELLPDNTLRIGGIIGQLKSEQFCHCFLNNQQFLKPKALQDRLSPNQPLKFL